MNILMIEDDLDLGRGVVAALKAQAIGCQWIRRVAEAPRSFEELAVDCVLLDLSLPDGVGYDLLANWRRNKVTIPIVIMTARSRLEDKLAGLDGGADDFIVKPFAPAELISRVRAVVRRYAQQASQTWSVGALEIDTAAHAVRLNGAAIDLTPREFGILRELARSAGAVVSKDVLAKRLSPFGEPLDVSAIEVHVFNLRRKMGPDLIKTIRGIGYMLSP
jgi:DNA-binding response OmpR family regulator